MLRKEGFCLNSRRWLRFIWIVPRTCPLKKEQMTNCENCGYYKEKTITKYALNKLEKIRQLRDKSLYKEDDYIDTDLPLI